LSKLLLVIGVSLKLGGAGILALKLRGGGAGKFMGAGMSIILPPQLELNPPELGGKGGGAGKEEKELS